ncbi:MAG: shikimate dehydrogenase [Deltaproteobacteria bacterium]|nr:shikimate dehydrogenase [Deltaproteobacteria bacterium]
MPPKKSTWKIAGVIGDPIDHSLSPHFQNALFTSCGLKVLYLPFLVKPEHLGKFLKQAKESRGLLVGYNTDAPGYVQSLKNETGFVPKNKTVLLLGAGGAARAILYILAQQGAYQIYLANRTVSKAVLLAKRFKRFFPKTAMEPLPLTSHSLSKILPSVDLLVNATSIGMGGTQGTKIPLERLPHRSVISDLVYRPILTPLLSQAKRRGLKIHPGWGLLLSQGALSFELWTGIVPRLDIMKKALLDALVLRFINSVTNLFTQD